MQSEASAVIGSVVKTTPSWVATALAWGDVNFPRILLVLSIAYTAVQLYSAVKRLKKGKPVNE
jgi:hypothetical protein